MPFAHDLTGTLLDRRYQIIGLLGKGGMGHVYEAIHVALEQRVAIKVLHPRFAAEERFRERFIREARSASKINHRNVVRITDFGDTPDDSVYFVMERLEGHDVGEELRRSGAMPWARARHILLQAVGALRAAHAKDIIHRDIKPANCLLTVEEGIADVVKLLDFGIAKVGSDSTADARGKGLTSTGEVFGTAAYMAPEQARGSELDARSDMYSLGIMAYEMLTGQVPFTGVNAIHVITKHLNEAPAPPREHDPTIAAEVEALVLKMIAKEATQRYGSMDALEQALRAIPEHAGQSRDHSVAPPGAVVQPIPHHRDHSVPPPGAVAQPIPHHRDHSVPPPGAVAQPIHGYSDQSRPLAGATPRSLPGGRDPSVPPPGAIAQPIPSNRDPSVPPPSRRDPSIAMQPAWPSGASSTGPLARTGDSSTETSPQSLSTVAPPLLTGRVLALVVSLVVLVGGSSALMTMVFLKSQDETQGVPKDEPEAQPEPTPEAPAVVPAAGDAAPPSTGTEQAPPSSKLPAAESPTGPSTMAPSTVAETEADTDVTTTDGASPAADAAAGSSTGGDGDEELVDEPDRESTHASDDSAEPAKRSRPMHETSECTKQRSDAEAALETRAWGKLLDLTRKRWCWSSAQQLPRLRLHVRALAELRRFADCIKAGGSSKDPEIQGTVTACKKRLE